MKLLVILASLLLATAPAFADDFDYSAYGDATLAGLSAEMQIDPRVLYFFDAAHPKYHTVATFSGNVRPASPTTVAFVQAWAKSLGYPPEVPALFTSEIQVVQAGVTYWLPIQQALVAPLTQEVLAGKALHLYLLLMGAQRKTPVFAVNEFDAVDG